MNMKIIVNTQTEIMTQKEKAMQIVMRFDREGETDNAKQRALICIDNDLELLSDLGNKLYTKLGTDSYMERCVIHDLRKELEKVKQEIEKL